MAEEPLRDGEGVTTNVFVTGDPKADNTRSVALDRGIRELVGWIRRTSPGMTFDANAAQAWCVDEEAGEFEVSGHVYVDECAICGESLGTRFHDLRDLGGNVHGPCLGFHEERVAAGYPEAKTPAELEARYRADPTRNFG